MVENKDNQTISVCVRNHSYGEIFRVKVRIEEARALLRISVIPPIVKTSGNPPHEKKCRQIKITLRAKQYHLIYLFHEICLIGLSLTKPSGVS